MPELPEVETTRRGIEPWLVGAAVTDFAVHQRQLRWPVPEALDALVGARVRAVTRRAKYLLIDTLPGTAIVHLGMSGSLRVYRGDEALRKHDHVDLKLDNGHGLRFHDPRRFGSWLWQAAGAPLHPRLASLGPEPFEAAFSPTRLFERSRGSKAPVKTFIMNNATVVGVGNIYASEALYRAGVRPGRAAGRVTRREYAALHEAIVTVLQAAIQQGGTTLRDFLNSDGEPGYFAQSLNVYGRAGEPCHRCGSTVSSRVIGQRSTFWCRECQR
ncbi:MAG: bifunctional DNA-formamidopyrimidine glycosylase/DNA-(apurinic or apyrimidinic site) lyase [Pseudomonadota bacterium]